MTRNKNSEKAKALAKQGVEVVEADIDDVESLKQAFAGAYGAYCVTFFWEHMSPEKELQEAENLAIAAGYSGIQHAIWSTLEDTRKWVPVNDTRMPTLKDKYKVPHFDVKGEANSFFTKYKVPTTFLLTSFYWDNFIHFGMGPQKGPDGKLAITFPMGNKKLPGIAAADIGKCAFGIFKAGSKYIGQSVGIAGDHVTGNEMADTLSDIIGKEIAYNEVPPDVYRGFGFPGADDLGNMFQFKQEFEDYFCGARSLDFSRSLNPALQSFEAWAAENKERIPIGE
ncbi:NmrA/HSCARG family protein [bacterium]|nr:NmrA/HSCARG family protein [bacterium]